MNELVDYQSMIDPNFRDYTIQNDIIITPFWKKEFCDYLIDVAERTKFRVITDMDESVDYLDFTEFDNNLFEQINTHYIKQVVPFLQREWFIYHTQLKEIYSPYIIKYNKECTPHYWKHTDYGMISTNIKLNTDYTGANITFPRQKFSVKDVPIGHAIFWPSQITHPHYVDAIQDGTKYSVCIFTPAPITSKTKSSWLAEGILRD